jgi:hypothetical protein
MTSEFSFPVESGGIPISNRWASHSLLTLVFAFTTVAEAI